MAGSAETAARVAVTVMTPPASVAGLPDTDSETFGAGSVLVIVVESDDVPPAERGTELTVALVIAVLTVTLGPYFPSSTALRVVVPVVMPAEMTMVVGLTVYSVPLIAEPPKPRFTVVG